MQDQVKVEGGRVLGEVRVRYAGRILHTRKVGRGEISFWIQLRIQNMLNTSIWRMLFAKQTNLLYFVKRTLNYIEDLKTHNLNWNWQSPPRMATSIRRWCVKTLLRQYSHFLFTSDSVIFISSLDLSCCVILSFYIFINLSVIFQLFLLSY